MCGELHVNTLNKVSSLASNTNISHLRTLLTCILGREKHFPWVTLIRKTGRKCSQPLRFFCQSMSLSTIKQMTKGSITSCQDPRAWDILNVDPTITEYNCNGSNIYKTNMMGLRDWRHCTKWQAYLSILWKFTMLTSELHIVSNQCPEWSTIPSH
jgi:hypothetical protein